MLYNTTGLLLSEKVPFDDHLHVCGIQDFVPAMMSDPSPTNFLTVITINQTLQTINCTPCELNFLNDLLTWRSVNNTFARTLQSASCLLALAFLSLRTSARPGKSVFGSKLNFDVDLFCVEIGGQLRDLFRNFQFYDTCSWKGNKARQDCEL